MLRPIVRAAALAFLGAMAGAVWLVIVFALRAEVSLEMDRDLPRNLSGVYPPERDGERTFGWTTGRADLRLAGFDRQLEWTCSVAFRGGRSSPAVQPVVSLAADGLTSGSAVATNEYQTLDIAIPERSQPGLTLTLIVSETMTPGPQDPRELGVQIDRVACHPAEGGVPLPPRALLSASMITAAIFGAAFSLLRFVPGTTVAATILVAAGQALPFTVGMAPYSSYSQTALRLGVWIPLLMVLAARVLEGLSGRRLRNTAKFVVAFAGAALYLKLLALLHPSKSLVDAVFQAHRLEWVLSGRYFFTQPMPQGVQFPYAIGLYVFAAPWSAVTGDFVTLLRIVVCATEAIAGASLYPMIVVRWGDRLAGAVAVALFSLVPMAFWFIGNANLTNVFAQTIAVMTIVAATTLPTQTRRTLPLAGLALLTALALLSHVSTLVILLATLAALSGLYWGIGGRELRRPALLIAGATLIAVVLSVVLYYGHFTEVYIRALEAGAERSADTVEHSPMVGGLPEGAGKSFPERFWNALILSTDAIGWPILLLTAVGAWRAWVSGITDRVMMAILAWTCAYVVFVGVGLMPVEAHLERYSVEFVGRAVYATYPAAIVLAAYGSAWAWRAGRVTRLAASTLLLCAVVLGVQGWLSWLQ